MNTGISKRRVRRGRRGRQGFTVLEVILAIMVLAIAAGAAGYAMTVSLRLGRIATETDLALRGAESAIDAMRTAEFDEIFAAFNDATADDASIAPTPAPGSAFDVKGLAARLNDPDGRVGRIEFPGNGVVLNEGVVDPELGMPRDLNGDADAADLIGGGSFYEVLPVRVRVEWRGVGGDRAIEVWTTIVSE